MSGILHPRAPIHVCGYASAAGYDEFRGPLGPLFDFHDDSDRFGGKTWEKAEEGLGQTVFNLALGRAGLAYRDIDFLMAGDLQNQCVASSDAYAPFGIPYLGLYGACSTFVEGMLLASLTLCGTADARRAAVVVTSHNCAAERQFRLPLEYGGQRTPTAQWTATAGGCVLLEAGEGEVCLTRTLPGRMVDAGIRDAANMGAAMAPAAADTLLRYFGETGEDPAAYDAIVTGDLGREGSAILADLLAGRGVSLAGRHRDCGVMLYDPAHQDVHAGGSGCGCIASVTAAYWLPRLFAGDVHRVLFMATGALMSPASIQQGGSIVGVAPLCLLERKGGNT